MIWWCPFRVEVPITFTINSQLSAMTHESHNDLASVSPAPSLILATYAAAILTYPQAPGRKQKFFLVFRSPLSPGIQLLFLGFPFCLFQLTDSCDLLQLRYCLRPFLPLPLHLISFSPWVIALPPFAHCTLYGIALYYRDRYPLTQPCCGLLEDKGCVSCPWYP